MSITASTKQMFDALRIDNTKSTISAKFFKSVLAKNGLHGDDQRLRPVFDILGAMDGDDLTLEQFAKATHPCSTLVYKCISNQLRIPDFERLEEVLRQVFKIVEPNKGGANASYIPQLAMVDPEQFSISFCSVDGQRISIGDSKKQFCIQSCSKPINYLIALREFGAKYVHNSVGTEPSGRSFNEMVLKDVGSSDGGHGASGRGIPHNPMINAGAVMSVSMVYPSEKSRDARREKVMDVWRQLSGGADAPIGYSEETYVSESKTADRNWCLGYMMKERKAFPKCFTSLKETLELYFQICSLLSTNDAMAIMASTLANGGLCPLTGEKVFTPEQVRSVLPLMLTCGMYDYSGQWAYDVGIPAKSGVGGCIFMVIPNVGGFSIWSPRLDACGNSERGVHAATELCRLIKLHNFEVFSGLSQTKFDPSMKRYISENTELGGILFAASQGDVNELRAAANSGIDLFAGDYDMRTALHLAASEGHIGAVRFLTEAAGGDLAKINAKDRWGGTALGDATFNKFKECADVIREAGGVEGSLAHCRNSSDEVVDAVVESDAYLALKAASENDTLELIHMSANGHNLFAGDYDSRTALHLAASNGHLDTVKYLVSQAVAAKKLPAVLGNKDRFGATAYDDAVREKKGDVADFLKGLSGGK